MAVSAIFRTIEIGLGQVSEDLAEENPSPFLYRLRGSYHKTKILAPIGKVGMVNNNPDGSIGFVG